MKTILRNCRTSQALLRGRIAQLRVQMKNPKLSPVEVQRLDVRRRLLSEEAHELGRIAETIQPYLAHTAAAEYAGDAYCR